MKKFIAYLVGMTGAKLWRIGGWTGDEQYEDLNVLGKIGYHLFCKGTMLALGVTNMDDAVEVILQKLNSEEETR